MSKYITIDGFEQLSKQQMFDMAVSHIKSTGVKSCKLSGNCIYSGTGCNASIFIKPDFHNNADEGVYGGSSWVTLAKNGVVPLHEYRFVSDLQSAHDRCERPEKVFKREYVGYMAELAANHRLDPTSLNKMGW